MFSGGTAFRTPSYFPLWNQKRRKRSAPSVKDRASRNSSGPLMNDSRNQSEGGGGDSCGISPLKVGSPRGHSAAASATDNHSTDTKLSGDSGGVMSSMAVTISPRHKDPDRIKKDREREERVRQAREKLEEERKKKLIELKEQQRQAQENREKQLEIRRKKIEDLRRREMERRTEVEKRRREKEHVERSRRESLLLKAEERVARYEAWKRSGQKGGRVHVLGFGSATPRHICQPSERHPRRSSSSHAGTLQHSPSQSWDSSEECSFPRSPRRALSACSTVRHHCCVDLNRSGPPPGSAMPSTKRLSVSTSVLYNKRQSDFASSGGLNTSNRPDSLLALNTIPEGRRSVLAPSNLSTSRPKSIVNISSAGSGGGGVVGVKMRERLSPRSSSSKPRPASVAGSMPSFVNVSDSSKSPSSASVQSPRSQSTDRLARERARSRGATSASRAEGREEEEKKSWDNGGGVKMSRKTLERLSTPRQAPNAGDGDRKEASSTPRREPNLVRKSLLREKAKEAPAKQQQTPKDKEAGIRPHRPKDSPARTPQQQKKTASLSPAPSPLSVGPAASSSPRASSPSSRTSLRVLSPAPGADEDGGTSLSRPSPTPGEKPATETAQPPASPTPLETSTQEAPLPSTSPTPPETSATEICQPDASSTPANEPAAEMSESHATPTPTEKSKVETPQARSTPTLVEKSGAETPQQQSRSAGATPVEKTTGDITAEEYKAKLAEKRRQAREKAEREAEEERRRKEEEERLEEERQQQEEEEQRKTEEESVQLAEEGRRAEEERLQKAIQAEEARKAEEAARLEQERLAKEEAERKAKEEAERLDQEKQEKARREEEERLERKKRLEMIMKRVKTDNTGEGAKDSPRAGSSPARSLASPVNPSDSLQVTVQNTPAQSAATVAQSSEERKRSMDSNADESRSPVSGTRSPANTASPVPFAAALETSSLSSSQENMLDSREGSTPTSSRSESPAFTPRGSETERPKFKSPLLQKLVEGKDDVGSSPGEGHRFKSPLLQNLLNKTRVGARLGLSQQDYSRSSPDLSQVEGSTSAVHAASSPSSAMVMSSSMMDMDTVNSASKEALNKNSVNSASKEELNRKEEKDVDTSEDSSSSPARKALFSNGEGSRGVAQSASPGPQDSGPTPLEPGAAPHTTTTSSTSLWGVQDSGVSLGVADLYSLAPAMSLSLNGHDPEDASFQGQGLEESGLGLQSVDSVNPAPLTDSAASREHSTDDQNFEELIDLSIINTTFTTSTTSTVFKNNSDELMSFTKLEEGSEQSTGLPPPIIAFEETSKLKHQDVTDLLS